MITLFLNGLDLDCLRTVEWFQVLIILFDIDRLHTIKWFKILLQILVLLFDINLILNIYMNTFKCFLVLQFNSDNFI